MNLDPNDIRSMEYERGASLARLPLWVGLGAGTFFRADRRWWPLSLALFFLAAVEAFSWWSFTREVKEYDRRDRARRGR